jgi:hypothetical protein
MRDAKANPNAKIQITIEIQSPNVKTISVCNLSFDLCLAFEALEFALV